MMRFFLIGILAVVLTAGCVSNNTQSPDAMIKNESSENDQMMDTSGDSMMDDHTDDSMMDENAGDSMMKDDDSMMAKGVEYVPFTQAAYDQAKAEGKTIFLEFYANWCPICKAQAPALESGLSGLKSDTLVAFRVNYKDSETDSDEAALAKKYNVTYQHTHVVVDAAESVLLKSNEEWSADDVKAKLGEFS